MNQCFTLQEHLKNLSFPCLRTNKKDLLHVRHWSYHYYLLGTKYLCQHDTSLTYEHVLSNYVSCEYVDVVQKIVNKGTNVNTKGENGKMCLYLAYLNNHDGIISKLCMALNFIFISIVWICVISCNYVIIMWELYA
jgi:hypothetical protein